MSYANNVPVDSSSNTFFYVQAFNTEVDASSGLISALADISFNANVVAEFDCSLNVLQTLFRFSTDAIDVMDTSSNDILYQINYNRTGNTLETNDVSGSGVTVLLCDYDASNSCPIPLSANWIVNTTCVGTDTGDNTFISGTSAATYRQVPYDFVRYIAQNLFNTYLGVDLFNNEEFMRDDINKKARISLDTQLSTIYGLGTTQPVASGELADKFCPPGTYIDNDNSKLHPSEVILRKIMDVQPNRLSALDTYIINGNTDDVSGNAIPIYKMPLESGDAVVFQLTINADPNQRTDVNIPGAAIAERTYRIIIWAV